MYDKNMIYKAAIDCGFYEAGEVSVASLKFSEDIRHICEGNACMSYGKTWACPPAIGSVESCRKRCLSYDRMLLVSGKYELEDSFDLDGMKGGLLSFKRTMDEFDDKFKYILTSYLILSNEGCVRCEKCAYPESSCRFPDKLFHSIEGYGLIVSELAAQAGIAYINGKNTVTFFGAVLYNL